MLLVIISSISCEVLHVALSNQRNNIAHKIYFRYLNNIDMFKLINKKGNSKTMDSSISAAGADLICKHCKKQFSRIGNLNVHIKGVHLNARNHNCEVCGKTFKSKYYLTTHLRTHTGEKPYKCTHCNSAFADHSHFRQHVQDKHEESVCLLVKFVVKCLKKRRV